MDSAGWGNAGAGCCYSKRGERLCAETDNLSDLVKSILESDVIASVASCATRDAQTKSPYCLDTMDVTRARLMIPYLESSGRYAEARRLACATNNPREVRLTVLSGSPAKAVRLICRPPSGGSTPKYASWYLPVPKTFDKFECIFYILNYSSKYFLSNYFPY